MQLLVVMGLFPTRALGALCVAIRLKNGKGEWTDVTFSAIKCSIPREAVGKWVELTLIFTTPGFGSTTCGLRSSANCRVREGKTERR